MTDIELRVRGLYKQGMRQASIASYLGCSQGYVSDILRHSRKAPLDAGRIRALRRAGWDDYEISKDMELALGRDVRVEEILDARIKMGI